MKQETRKLLETLIGRKSNPRYYRVVCALAALPALPNEVLQQEFHKICIEAGVSSRRFTVYMRTVHGLSWRDLLGNVIESNAAFIRKRSKERAQNRQKKSPRGLPISAPRDAKNDDLLPLNKYHIPMRKHRVIVRAICKGEDINDACTKRGIKPSTFKQYVSRRGFTVKDLQAGNARVGLVRERYLKVNGISPYDPPSQSD